MSRANRFPVDQWAASVVRAGVLCGAVILLPCAAAQPARAQDSQPDDEQAQAEEPEDDEDAIRPLVVRDEFDGKLKLKWRIVRPDAANYSLNKQPGRLVITTQRGSIHGDEKNDAFGEGMQARNLFLIDNPLPRDADFQIVTCVCDFAPETIFQQAGLLVYNDDDNYLKWGYEFDGPTGEGQAFVLVRETEQMPVHERGPLEPGLKKMWLRLTKRGNTYTYATSDNGERYIVYGEREWGEAPPERIGFLAKNGGNPQATALDAAFEFFELRELPSEDAE
ncbi:MAG: DUF1349 domain-containing protein [Pirellulales bacterium]